ncbi:MAG: exo-alpha-sialidase [Betaproteobacteria bacterium]|nr:exo-alpha-sialidase [Betaproteobacteria bacterium]
MVRQLTSLAIACLISGAAVAHDHAAHQAPKRDYAKVWLENQEKAPRLAVAASFDPAGRLWRVQTVGKHLKLSSSDDGGAHFSAPLTVNREPELISSDGEARPQIAIVGQRIYLSWTQALPQPFAGHIRFAVSQDGGHSFSDPITVNDDTRPITHRFNAMLADQQGVTLSWIDKRDGADRAEYRGAAIYTARSTDGGRSFEANRKLEDHSCECCRIGMASDRDGTPVILWRQIFGRNIRDFALARLGEPLRRVSEDDWKIDACPHHGGAIAIDVEGTRHIVWFTGAEKSPGPHYRRIDGQQMSSPMPFGNLDAQAGHPAVAVSGNEVTLVWREFDGSANRIMSMRSTNRGTDWSAPSILASTRGAADYPQLIRGQGGLWLIWNTAEDGFKAMRVGT